MYTLGNWEEGSGEAHGQSVSGRKDGSEIYLEGHHLLCLTPVSLASPSSHPRIGLKIYIDQAIELLVSGL